MVICFFVVMVLDNFPIQSLLTLVLRNRFCNVCLKTSQKDFQHFNALIKSGQCKLQNVIYLSDFLLLRLIKSMSIGFPFFVR